MYHIWDVNGDDSYPNCDQLSNTTNMTNILIFFAVGIFHLTWYGHPNIYPFTKMFGRRWKHTSATISYESRATIKYPLFHMGSLWLPNEARLIQLSPVKRSSKIWKVAHRSSQEKANSVSCWTPVLFKHRWLSPRVLSEVLVHIHALISRGPRQVEVGCPGSGDVSWLGKCWQSWLPKNTRGQLRYYRYIRHLKIQQLILRDNSCLRVALKALTRPSVCDNRCSLLLSSVSTALRFSSPLVAMASITKEEVAKHNKA